MQLNLQPESDSSNSETARETPAEQPSEVAGRGSHEALPVNRESNLPTSNIQAQRNERNMPQMNPDQGIYKKLYSCFFDFTKSKRAY